MKQADIKIGHTYAAKITDKVVPVRIDAARTSGGWDATNVTTNRKVVIKSAAKLRKELPSANLPGDAKPAAKEPVKKKLSTAERRARVTQANAKSAKATTNGEPAVKQEPVTPQEKRLSLIDAAVQVLGDAKEPMNTKQMVERITEAGLWSPRSGGKTPHATLTSAILREVQTKGAAARFTKVERGHYTLNKGD